VVCVSSAVLEKNDVQLSIITDMLCVHVCVVVVLEVMWYTVDRQQSRADS